MVIDELFSNTSLVDWIGYMASLVVMISFIMNSMLRLRIVNLIGALLFATYGFMIDSMPVIVTNVLIVFFNIYNIWKLQKKENDFSIIEMTQMSRFVEKFLEKNGKYIYRSFPDFKFEKNEDFTGFYILSDMSIVGIFMTTHYDKDTLRVDIDYVLPNFRDFKIGTYIHHQINKDSISKGYKRLLCETQNKKHILYLEKMGYKPEKNAEKTVYVKTFGGE